MKKSGPLACHVAAAESAHGDGRALVAGAGFRQSNYPMRVVLIWLFAAACGSAVDWPQWRGPFFNGSTTETNLPSSWSGTSNLLWALPLPGPGSATPVVCSNRVFLLAADKSADKVLALAADAQTGRPLWAKSLGPDRKAPSGNNDAATPSPVTDGQTVWFMTGTGLLTALTVDGRLRWQRNLAAEDGGDFVLNHGYSSSPLLFDGRLYVAVLQNDNPQRWGQRPAQKKKTDSYLLAIDPANGKTLWKQLRPTNATDESREGYVTPYPFVWKQRREIVLIGGECVTGHDAATGAELWRWWFSPPDRQEGQHVEATPVALDDLVFVIRARGRPLFALRPEGRGELDDRIVAWRFEENRGQVPSPLLYKNRLYVVQDNERKLVCLNPQTGEIVWQQQLPVRVRLEASPTAADDKIYCISLLGEVVVLAAGDKPAVLGRVTFPEPLCRSTIVAANGRLYIRTARHLYCVGHGSAQHAP
ncbi:MAG: PQQ-binding-like beta-propeller repeat protein [Verrucomicrobiae bacterium]|nr:PQQ-binding-like beta-propeller repeat protein [Verrucomicrobiae bacterium]